MRRRLIAAALALLTSVAGNLAPAASEVRVEQAADGVAAAAEVEGCEASLELNRKWGTLHYRNDCAQPLNTKVATFTTLFISLAAAPGPQTKIESLFLGRLIHYPELVAEAALAAHNAADWDTAAGNPRQPDIDANRYFTALLREAGVLRAFLEVLAAFNMASDVASVEKVLIGSPAATPVEQQLLAAGVARDARLPFDAMVWLSLRPGESSR